MRFSFHLWQERDIKWGRKIEKSKGGRAANIFFEQHRPVVYLMIALLLLNLTFLSSLSVPINTFPLQHSWNSSHISSLQQPPAAPPCSLCYSTICYYSLVAFSASQTEEIVNICSDIKVMPIAMHFQPQCYCIRTDFVSLLLYLPARDVNNSCHALL